MRRTYTTYQPTHGFRRKTTMALVTKRPAQFVGNRSYTTVIVLDEAEADGLARLLELEVLNEGYEPVLDELTNSMIGRPAPVKGPRYIIHQGDEQGYRVISRVNAPGDLSHPDRHQFEVGTVKKHGWGYSVLLDGTYCDKEQSGTVWNLPTMREVRDKLKRVQP
jgi:hypothetical protein